MTDNEADAEHLTPELFVDVLGNSPIEATRRRHLETCVSCATELRELEGTLAVLKQEPRAKLRRPYAAWLAAAAVLVLAVSFLFRASSPDTRPAEAVLLPPTSMDDGYQLLVALSRELGDDAVADALGASGALASTEISELTDEERQELLERLAAEVLETESSS